MRPGRKTLGGQHMYDYALVLNAGSSSLKFCVFGRPEAGEWQLESRGQTEGVGTPSRISARHRAGTNILDEKLEASVRDQRSALDALARWLSSMYGGSRVL